MKHIFTIHSPLTFLMAYGIIKHQNLPAKDVILLSTRYKVPLAGFNVYPAYAEQRKSFIQKVGNLNLPKGFDAYIDTITQGDTFIAYVDLMSYYQKILVTHKACQQFHFMEEGNSAYMAFDDLADLTWSDRKMGFRVKHSLSNATLTSLVRVLRGFNLRLLSLPYHYMAYVNFAGIRFFSFSDNAFYNAPKQVKTLIPMQKEDPAMLQLANNIQLDQALIWIDGSNGRYTGLPESMYYQAIDKAIEVLKNRGEFTETIHVKLRPNLTEYESNYLVSALKKSGAKVEVLPDDMVLESLFIVSRHCTVVGNLTAALEYAHVFGHKAYSIYSLFEKQNPTFLDRMDGFWKNVQRL